MVEAKEILARVMAVAKDYGGGEVIGIKTLYDFADHNIVYFLYRLTRVVASKTTPGSVRIAVKVNRLTDEVVVFRLTSNERKKLKRIVVPPPRERRRLKATLKENQDTIGVPDGGIKCTNFCLVEASGK